jgi:hypothetical protein
MLRLFGRARPVGLVMRFSTQERKYPYMPHVVDSDQELEEYNKLSLEAVKLMNLKKDPFAKIDALDDLSADEVGPNENESSEEDIEIDDDGLDKLNEILKQMESRFDEDIAKLEAYEKQIDSDDDENYLDANQ